MRLGPSCYIVGGYVECVDLLKTMYMYGTRTDISTKWSTSSYAICGLCAMTVTTTMCCLLSFAPLCWSIFQVRSSYTYMHLGNDCFIQNYTPCQSQYSPISTRNQLNLSSYYNISIFILVQRSFFWGDIIERLIQKWEDTPNKWGLSLVMS